MGLVALYAPRRLIPRHSVRRIKAPEARALATAIVLRAPLMITGYNTDVRNQEVVFHVQTEDK